MRYSVIEYSDAQIYFCVRKCRFFITFTLDDGNGPCTMNLPISLRDAEVTKPQEAAYLAERTYCSLLEKCRLPWLKLSDLGE